MNANQQRFGRIGRPSTFYILREVTLCSSLLLESPSVLRSCLHTIVVLYLYFPSHFYLGYNILLNVIRGLG